MLKEILILTTIAVVVGVGIALLAISFPVHKLIRYENSVICAEDKGWRFKPAKKVCYGIYELRVDPNIHYELEKGGE